MNHIPTTAVIDRLLSEKRKPLVSLYMPTHRAGADIWQDRIRLKNLLRSAKHEIEALDLSRNETDALLRPISDRLEDRTFWQYQGDGLAFFASPDGTEEFRLPTPVPELCVVGDSYHLKPLLMSLADERGFFVLALSQKSVRLFAGSPYGMRLLDGLDLPQAPEVNVDGPQKSLQAHSAGRGTHIPHAAELDHKALLAAFCKRVDKAIESSVPAGTPLILAGVDFLAAIYREVSAQRTISPATISGNPDATAVDQLFQRALPIAQAHFEDQRLEAENRFFDCLGAGKAPDGPLETIQAARQGRVETLFVPIGVQIWGQTNDDGEVRMSASQQPQDQDLLNVALVSTWKSGGRVLAMSPEMMPGGRQIAAITRF